ncbi:hypothetical protein NG799_27685 [Laspinema sp. D1]|uniref:Uncharacterized protein n=1 Tax=Laspinema palackyanum D2a TaxID=2953684 RepID=A0ABT2MZC0_9CYAN|nr:hypothetical protein [Laspinema sp. D2a]
MSTSITRYPILGYVCTHCGATKNSIFVNSKTPTQALVRCDRCLPAIGWVNPLELGGLV